MKKLFLALVAVAALYVGWGQTEGLHQRAGVPDLETRAPASSRADDIRAAFSERDSGTQVTGKGVVTKLLADDSEGSRHQRFILKLASGQTVLVAHNIDLAPRIDSLEPGDSVSFNGVYEWNAKGGVVHWTHHDPSGRHEAGWLRHSGQTYQ
jgi:hypothetical protein